LPNGNNESEDIYERNKLRINPMKITETGSRKSNDGRKYYFKPRAPEIISKVKAAILSDLFNGGKLGDDLVERICDELNGNVGQ
jgi:hypothetical protein